MLISPLFAPPETTNYMIAGYIVIFAVMVAYIASLFLRRRKFEQDIEILQELDDQNDNS
jgi:cbb3-type cytochrome oxidase subunit 3